MGIKGELMEKRNNYFYASAILTIVLASIEILAAIIAISIFYSMKESIIAGLNDPTRIDFIQGAIVTTTVISMVVGVLTIVVGCFFFSFAKYTQQQVNDRTAFIVIMIILQIVFGGLVACAISVAGIIAGREGEMAQINYDKAYQDSFEERLKKLKNLYDEKLIDEEEYKNLRSQILSEMHQQD